MNVAEVKARIAALDDRQAERYWARDNVQDLIDERTAFFDDLLRELWENMMSERNRRHSALIAVGGYGRGKLHPGSDIDLLVLTRRRPRVSTDIETFVRFLWDVGMEVGHSVRTPKDCRRKASEDITIMTALLERRLLAGSKDTAAKLDTVMNSTRLWPPDRFYRAKRDEQADRHKQYDNTDYGLEPNIKNSPGGLRDLQTALWICLRQFGTNDPDDLVARGVLTAQEREWLVEGRRYLSWVRFGLHLIVGRKEDRLQFEYQRELAERLGFVDTDAKLGVERFMHHYYRHVLELRELNDILLQHFAETILARGRDVTEPVNERFQIRNGYIETCTPEVFQHHPSALLELFVIMANRRDISGVRADTIRLIRANLLLIDDGFRKDPDNTERFLALLKAPHTLVSQLTRMRRYGILGRYIPEFGEVIGQMQHDLFHIYTVDAHTMMVIRNMRRFFYRSAEVAFPVAHHCVKVLPKIELLYIAGLYHDIGKGRGGDHSTLGATDAAAFCRRHRLPEADVDLVVWLVEQHLLMSATAQRKDIYDPDVVMAFARVMKSELRLNYLYALTVADINATNPTLWNSWRATLLRQLYTETRKTLRRGLESPVDREFALEQARAATSEHLERGGVDTSALTGLWPLLGDEIFLRHSPAHVAQLVAEVLDHDPTTGALVLVDNIRSHAEQEGATEITIYTQDRPNLFAATVITLDQLNLSIHDANINTGPRGMCLNTFVVLDAGGGPVTGRVRERRALGDAISKRLAQPSSGKPNQRRVPRQLKQLRTRTEVTLRNPRDADHSELTIVAADRPGLLASVGALFQSLNVAVSSAKINTLGERVEDVFWVHERNGERIHDPERIYTIEQTIRQDLDARVARAS